MTALAWAGMAVVRHRAVVVSVSFLLLLTLVFTAGLNPGLAGAFIVTIAELLRRLERSFDQREPQPIRVEIVSLVGMSLAGAEAWLAANDLTPILSDVRTRRRPKDLAGNWMVVKTTPKAGFRWAKGGSVLLVVERV